MPVNRLLKELTSADISEWMAFDQLKDTEYKERIESESLTDDERMENLKALLGFKQ